MLLVKSLKQVVENGFFITSKAILKGHEIQSSWLLSQTFLCQDLNIFLLNILLTTVVLQREELV